MEKFDSAITEKFVVRAEVYIKRFKTSGSYSFKNMNSIVLLAFVGVLAGCINAQLFAPGPNYNPFDMMSLDTAMNDQTGMDVTLPREKIVWKCDSGMILFDVGMMDPGFNGCIPLHLLLLEKLQEIASLLIESILIRV